MTVDELIEHLQDLKSQGHGEKEVMFSYNYGDHWRTTVAEKVEGSEVGPVKYSDYHSMWKVVDMTDDEGESRERPDGCSDVVILH